MACLQRERESSEFSITAAIRFELRDFGRCRWTTHNSQQRVAAPSSPPFKCAIFFSAPVAYASDPLEKKGQFRALTRAQDGELIGIPTAHIWGRKDTTIDAATVSGLGVRV